MNSTALASMKHPSLTADRRLFLISLVYFLFFTWLGLSRHWTYLTSANDLGSYDQTVWTILHGSPFLNTANVFGHPISRLALHFDPVLALFAPFYAMLPAPEWLIVGQALAITVAAWPLYALGVRVLQSDRAALLWALAYLFNPFVISAAVWDFQTVTLAAPVMALGILATELGHAPLFLFSCAMLLGVREHYGLAVLGFGVLWWLRRRTPLPSLVAIVLGLGGFCLVNFWIIPMLSPTGRHVMMSGGLGSFSRYVWLGNSFGEIMQNILSHPIEVMTTLFVIREEWIYLGLLLLPLAFLPLAGGEFLLPGVADLAANLLSGNPMPRSVIGYHSIALIPVLIAAGMYGTARIQRLRGYSVSRVGALVICLTVIPAYVFAPLPLPGAMNVWDPVRFAWRRDPAVDKIKRLVPAAVTVSAQDNVAAHFSERFDFRSFPAGVGEADCLVLRLSSPTGRVRGDDPANLGSLAYHLQMSPAAYLFVVRNMITSRKYGLKYWNAPWLVLCRGLKTPHEKAAAIGKYLDELERAWGPRTGARNKD